MALAVLRLALLLLAVTFAGSARSGPGERGPPEKSGRGSQAGGGPCPAPGGLGDERQTALSIDYQDVPETLTLCVAVTCPLMPMNVLCA
ncbi:serine protease inhibitor Kazal-type 2 isoform X5 [Symphalangus syndactylus]|uniref:serine protease inhibitor Kazal-type 2 isoform X5 n=1 Tax=Symphalangus syndactylus TaxID=9590 RepID=UPI002441829E|nr:serine protease inhibitor Kazal-type 2 isoform X5 [Symphalangus syndactylus]